MKLRRLMAVARKESLHIARDPRSLILAIGIPMLMIILFGYALTLDVDRVPFVVWDQSRTPASREFIDRFEASRYFELQEAVQEYGSITRAIDHRRAMLALVIDADFAVDLGAQRTASVQAIVDGSDSNTAAIVMGYARAIVNAYNRGVVLERSARKGAISQAEMPLTMEPRVWFNADLESKNFIIPGLIAVIMGLIAALLTSLTVAREWERGTMEQLVSTPVKPVELIIGKLLPYFVIGMADVVIAVLMAVFVFDVPLRGSVPLLLGTAAVFIVGTLAQGIFISAVTRGQLLASQLAMVSTFLPAFLLSGFMFAISNMPPVVQGITFIVPARYFVALVKGIYLRGVGLEVLWKDGVFLVCFAVILTTLAVVRFKKRLD
ncbi:MAG TPA: ABC transporter permease [Opitutaceae bacterium]